jgi:hypothetical protein
MIRSMPLASTRGPIGSICPMPRASAGRPEGFCTVAASGSVSTVTWLADGTARSVWARSATAGDVLGPGFKTGGVVTTEGMSWSFISAPGTFRYGSISGPEMTRYEICHMRTNLEQNSGHTMTG